MSEQETQAELSQDQQELFDYDVAAFKASGVKNLEGRVKSGLDPQAMLILKTETNLGGDVRKPGTAESSHKIAELFGADETNVQALIEKLHTQGPWEDADRLLAATDPEIQTYLVLAAACHESGWPGYTPDKYLEDRARVVEDLRAASEVSPDKKGEMLQEKIVDLQSRVTIEKVEANGKVPVAEGDVALPLAIQGYKGVVAKAGEMRFAQTREINDAQLESRGLVRGYAEVYSAEADGGKGGFVRVTLQEAPTARVIWVDQSDTGKDVQVMQPKVKRIASGYVLTYTDEKLAVELVAESIENMEKTQ